MEDIVKKYRCNHNCDDDDDEKDPQRNRSVWLDLELQLPLGFQLEKAVCSHGLFMMPPNSWDPLSTTFTRPLRLQLHHHHPSSSSSFLVSVSQRVSSLSVRVHRTRSLYLEQQHALLAQVSRMLRLSEAEEKAVTEFSNMSGCGCGADRSFCGRVFRSPTLWEDMVKCILLCNCKWSRTLSMSQALCELQLELQNGPPCTVAVSSNPIGETEGFIPNTPAAKVPGRKGSVSSKGSFHKEKLELEGNLEMDNVLASSCQSCQTKEDLGSKDSFQQFPNGEEYFNHVGNFPSPYELANLDKAFLAKRCKLGYRASRIIKLAQAVVEGKIQLGQLEELSKDASLSSYEQLEDQLKQIEGFGPFTVANVLMCMGYYHVIPTDSETIRHLKQVHSSKSTSRTIQRDVEKIYGKYKPYQFLAYWSEIWDFYERRFGKMNEMHHSDYKLMTANNMKSADKGTSKRKKPS
ncbi:hypothetical protein RIF29_40932 [Crotalaria pallida]|uniref:HhH-GPD domain-containing protein n=1 Tax=Crotalaria pallida TaxID=3830 RepID=A0AAN9HR23_CROPI